MVLPPLHQGPHTMAYGKTRTFVFRESWHNMVFVTNQVSESSFRRFLFFPNIRNGFTSKKIFGRRFFLFGNFYLDFEFFSENIFCLAEDYFVQH